MRTLVGLEAAKCSCRAISGSDRLLAIGVMESWYHVTPVASSNSCGKDSRGDDGAREVFLYFCLLARKLLVMRIEESMNCGFFATVCLQREIRGVNFLEVLDRIFCLRVLFFWATAAVARGTVIPCLTEVEEQAARS